MLYRSCPEWFDLDAFAHHGKGTVSGQPSVYPTATTLEGSRGMTPIMPLFSKASPSSSRMKNVPTSQARRIRHEQRTDYLLVSATIQEAQ
jgi:hypothetical protein